MPFEVKNANAVFQTIKSKVLKYCLDLARPYMDDVIIFSDS